MDLDSDFVGHFSTQFCSGVNIRNAAAIVELVLTNLSPADLFHAEFLCHLLAAPDLPFISAK